MRNFRNLDVWKDGINICREIYKLTSEFPIHERYGLGQQMNRCAVSIPSNIAEGSSRDSSKEFSRFLQIAIGSSFELETQLIISHKNSYCSDLLFDSLIDQINVLQKRLNALNRAILKKN